MEIMANALTEKSSGVFAYRDNGSATESPLMKEAHVKFTPEQVG
jgi:hypothetical protein